jgi:acetyl esterase/lipase
MMNEFVWLLVALALAGGVLIVVRPPLDMRSVPSLRALIARLGARSRRTTLRVAFNLVAAQFLVGLVVLELALHISALVVLVVGGVRPQELPLHLAAALVALCVALLSVYTKSYLQLQRRIGHALKAAGVTHVRHVHRNHGSSKHEHGVEDNVFVRWVREAIHCIVVFPQLFTRLPLSTVVVSRNVRFDDSHPRLVLDVMHSRVPRSLLRHRRPILLYLHGGSWHSGDKRWAPPLLAYAAARGWLCASAHYRLIPQHPFPSAVIDVKRAVRFLRANAERWHADPDCVLLAGGSAGAHLACVAALTPGVASLQPGFETADCRVQGVVALHAPLDLRRDATDADNQLEAWLERTMIQKSRADAPELYDLVSPTVLAERLDTAQIPPFFVVHGEHDSLVPIDQAQRFVAVLRRRRCPVVFVEAPLSQHMFDVLQTPRAVLLNRAIHLWARHVQQRRHFLIS